MNLQHIDIGFPITVVDNFYDSGELELIWEELQFLLDNNKLRNPKEMGSAFKSGKILANRPSVFLHKCFKKVSESKILTINKKVFRYFDQIFKKHSSWFFSNVQINISKTLISYYEDSNYYHAHRDRFAITCLTWFYKEPKSFEGGELSLHTSKGKKTIKLLNNRLVAFPSCIVHEVSMIKMKEGTEGKHMGRFCMSQFLSQ